MTYLRERIKWILFPGLDLHARERFHAIARYLPEGRNGKPRHILDAGCGNGMLSYRCYQLGDRVTGVSIKPGEINGNKRLFNGLMGIGEDRMTFLLHNLYQLDQFDQMFDGVICTEVLEHISDDSAVLRSFWNVLSPGGSLHLCCPNAEHVHHMENRLDKNEQGGHVRSGYTLADYHRLLEPIGFKIIGKAELGGPVRTFCNRWIIRTEERFGFASAFAVFVLLNPLTLFDVKPRVPFSLYVRAVKPG